MPFLNQWKDGNDRRKYFMIISRKDCCLPRWGSNLWPPGLQSDVHPTEPPRPTTWQSITGYDVVLLLMFSALNRHNSSWVAEERNKNWRVSLLDPCIDVVPQNESEDTRFLLLLWFSMFMDTSVWIKALYYVDVYMNKKYQAKFLHVKQSDDWHSIRECCCQFRKLINRYKRTG